MKISDNLTKYDHVFTNWSFDLYTIINIFCEESSICIIYRIK